MVVIGAGISGLTVAWNLKQAGVDVIVLEASTNVGGVMRTERRGGFLLEKGPFNVLVRDEAFKKMLEHFQDTLEPIQASGNSGRNRYVLHNSQLCKVPSNPLELIKTSLLSPSGKLRLIRGFLLSRRGESYNRSIDEAATRRFGREIADRLVSALCVGIYAAESTTLSLDGCFPRVAEMDDQIKSPLLFALRAMFRAKKNSSKPHTKHRGLVSFRDGLSSLTTLIAEELGDDLLMDCQTKSIKKSDSGFDIAYVMDNGDEEVISCKQVALCVGKTAASNLLNGISHTLQSQIESIPTSPVVVINLGFEKKQIGHPLDGYGYLVPNSESDCPLLGVLWADSVFPHHAPEGSRLLRVFIGGQNQNDTDTMSDDELVEIAVTAMRDVLQLTGDPTLVDINRWRNAIPHYTLDHIQRITRIDEEVKSHPGMHLLGNYMHGMSINDCVKNAAMGASRIVEQLNSDKQKSINKDKIVQHSKPVDHKAMEPIAHA